MRRELGWALLGKLAALIALWALFFSPAHRRPVDGEIAAERLALEAPSSSADSPAPARQGIRRDD